MDNLRSAIINRTLGIYLDANDYFNPGANAVYLSYADYDWALPIIEKWGSVGIEAVMCWICKAQHWRRAPSEELTQAYAELVALNPTIEESH